MKEIDTIRKDEFLSDYKPFLQNILTQIQSTRYEMLMSMSKQTLLLYWSIGTAVSAKMQAAGWGKSIVERLAKDLQVEIPGVRGFSARNIWRMKMFAEYYATLGLSAAAAAEIEEPLISATAVAEIQPNDTTLGIIPNSAPAGAEFQPNDTTPEFIPISATAVAEIQQPNEIVAIDVIPNSATTVAEFQTALYELVPNIGWMPDYRNLQNNLIR